MEKEVSAQDFPEIAAETLSGEKVIFPDVTKGKIGFIVLAFKRQTQGEVDSWLDPFIKQYGNDEQVTFYEIPMISTGWKFMAGWIDSGMRAGVARFKHPHVATYYGPLSDYYSLLNIQDNTLCYLYLLNRQGKIVWRSAGAADEKRLHELNSMVRKLKQAL